MKNLILIEGMKKWNNETRSYEPYKVPDEWNCPLYIDNMDEVINCVQCGKELNYGNGYTSKEIHNPFGLGYSVCENCYIEEWKRYKKECL